MARVFLDNDIVAKCAAYRLLSNLATALNVSLDDFAVLGTLRFVITERKLKTADVGAKVAHGLLREFLDVVEELEPTEEESAFAAQLEEAALRLDLSFDIGESQLCAIAIRREAQLLCTGDKRAVRSLEQLLQSFEEVRYLLQRVLPFEVLMKRFLSQIAHEILRSKICASNGTDKALEICFQCHSEVGTEASTVEGLDSYIRAIARDAPKLALTD